MWVGVGLTRRDEMCNRKFVSENADHSKCQWSNGIHDCLTVGQGELDVHGFWEHGCPVCARRHEVEHPEDGPVWPHKLEDIENPSF